MFDFLNIKTFFWPKSINYSVTLADHYYIAENIKSYSV